MCESGKAALHSIVLVALGSLGLITTACTNTRVSTQGSAAFDQPASPAVSVDSGSQEVTDKVKLSVSDISERLSEAMPENLSQAEQHRWIASSDVISGSVFRADAVASVNTDVTRIANYAVRSSTQTLLANQSREELVALLRSPTGFDDTVNKRCVPGISVGFNLQHESNPTETQRPATEIVVDFGCNKLTLVGSASAQQIADTQTRTFFFDPSRQGFINLVKNVLPDDRELDVLR